MKKVSKDFTDISFCHKKCIIGCSPEFYGTVDLNIYQMFVIHKNNPHPLVTHRYLSLSCLATILIANTVSAVSLCLHLPLNGETHGTIDGVKKKKKLKYGQPF